MTLNRFARAVRVEIRALYNTGARRVLIVAIFIVPFLIMLAASLASPDLRTSENFVISQAPSYVLLPLLAISTVVGEWSQRTGLITFSAEPNRSLVAGAKCLALTVLTLLVGVVAWAEVIAVNSVLSQARGIAVHGGFVASAASDALSSTVAIWLTVLTAVGIAYVIPFAAVAVSVFLVFTFAIDGLVTSIGSGSAWLRYNAAIEGVSAGDWGAHGQHAIGLVVWIGVPLGLGIWRSTRRDVR